MNHPIETHDLTRRFGPTVAVDRLNLSVPAGTVYAFLGANGAGKTTTIKTLLNLMPPSEGTASVLGVDSTRLGPEQFSRIGYVSENQQLPEWMTVDQFAAFCRPMYPGWDVDFAAKLRRDFDLPPRQKIKSLSRGMKMKAALLASLAYRPSLLVLDEPFTGLDPLVRTELIRGMLELSEQEGWTVFVSSHDIDEVERLADTVGIIDGGKLKLSESTTNLHARFRRLECVLPSPQSRPVSFPDSWLDPQVNGRRLSVVERDYRPGASEEALRRAFPEASDVTASEMTLREVFISLALAYRIQPVPPAL